MSANGPRLRVRVGQRAAGFHPRVTIRSAGIKVQSASLAGKTTRGQSQRMRVTRAPQPDEAWLYRGDRGRDS